MQRKFVSSNFLYTWVKEVNQKTFGKILICHFLKEFQKTSCMKKVKGQKMGNLQMKLLPKKQEYEYPRCRRYTAFTQAHSNAAREGKGNKKQGGADSVKKSSTWLVGKIGATLFSPDPPATPMSWCQTFEGHSHVP